MDRVPVGKSGIVSVGYDRATEVLEVEVEGGAVYMYLDVPAWIPRELLRAADPADFLEREMRKAGKTRARIR